jgi:sulfur carrier protein ThiS
MKRILSGSLLLILCAFTIHAQEVVAPETASIDTIKDLHRVYVITDDDDVRTTISKMLDGHAGYEVVTNPKEAEFYLEMTDLHRDTQATRSGGAIYQKSQMQAFIVRPDDKVRVVAWSETETYERHAEFVLSAPNEINLTHHFVNAVQKARGEKKSSLRDLLKKPKH